MSQIPARRRAALGLFCLTLALLGASAWMRKEWVTVKHPALAGQETINLVVFKNWYREGFLNLCGTIYLQPLSVEMSTPETRDYYASFPPGAGVPIYLVALALGREPSLEMAWGVGLALHGLLAFSLAFMVFYVVLQLGLGPRAAFIYALIAVLLAIFTRAPMYGYRLMDYTPSRSAAVWFAVYVALEAAGEGMPATRMRRRVGGLQGLCLFWGILNEWLFVFVAGCVYLNRLFQGRMGNTLREWAVKSALFFLPLALGLFVFLFQIYEANGIPLLLSRFEDVGGGTLSGYTIGSPAGEGFHVHLQFGPGIFWWWFITFLFGVAGWFILMATIALFLLFGLRAGRRRLRGRANSPAATRLLGLMFITLMPCILYSVVLTKYVTNPAHFFTVYKFTIPFATVPFVFLPLYLSRIREEAAGAAGLRRLSFLSRPHTCAKAMLALALCYVASEMAQYEKYIQRFPARPRLIRAATFLGKNTTYHDVVFSAERELCLIARRDLLPYSMKAVHRFESPRSMHKLLGDIQEEYVVNILAGKGPPLPPFLEALAAKAFETRAGPGLQLLKIHKADYLAVYEKIARAEEQRLQHDLTGSEI